MVQQQEGSLSPEVVLDQMKKNGVTHVVWLPDSETNDAIARACGYPRACAYDNLETFSIHLERILSGPGPVFVALKVRPEIENEPIGARRKWHKRSQVQAIADLQKELGIT